MNLANYSNDKLEQSKAYVPFWPNGELMDAKIFIKSMRSTEVMKMVDEINKRSNQGSKSIERQINNDIDLCCAVVDEIDGFTIEPDDNTFDFELNGNKVISNKKNIRLLMQNFLFLRQQIGAKVQDDSFFYED